MSGTPYLASEDSALIRRVLSGLSGERALEIGAGNCGNLVILAGCFRLAVGTDLIRPGMTDWREEGAELVLSDGASCIRDSSFDLVAFNPPYLRAEVVDRAVDGGEELEVPKKFMRDAVRVVRPTGKVVFLLDQGADVREFEAICAARGFSIRRVASERGFFEELSVYTAARE